MLIVENQSLHPPRFSDDERSGEIPCYQFIQDRFKPKVVFNVGAQKDFKFCQIFKDSEIHLFEPNKYWCRELMNNEELIKRENVWFNPFGLGNSNQYFTYFYRGESVYNHDGLNETSTIFVTTAEDYMKLRGITQVDFMKIDVEGYEWEVIKGIGGYLPHVEIIQFEYGERYPLAKKTLKMMYDLFPGRYLYNVEMDRLNLVPYVGEYYQYSNYLVTKTKL